MRCDTWNRKMENENWDHLSVLEKNVMDCFPTIFSATSTPPWMTYVHVAIYYIRHLYLSGRQRESLMSHRQASDKGKVEEETNKTVVQMGAPFNMKSHG